MTISCTNNSFEKHIIDNYYLKKINLNGIQFIGQKKDSLLDNGIWQVKVPDYVYAYGYNKNIIVAKLHPNYYPDQWKVNTSITEYYIIDLNQDFENVHGPLSITEFEEKMLDLNGEILEFDHFYSEEKK